MQVHTRRLSRARSQDGLTLVEMMVSIALLVIMLTAALFVFTRGMRIEAMSERDDQSVALAQQVMAQARQTSFIDLGFFDSDPDAPQPGAPITLPIQGTDGNPVSEPPVSLGTQRPQGSTPFVPALQRVVMDTRQGESTYRVFTTVTNPTGVEPATARRVTVQIQRAVGNVTHLTGDCTQEGTTCLTQSVLRAPTASDFDSVSGQVPEPACQPDQEDLICDAFIRSGRVLDGSTMVSAQDIPEQVSPVDLAVRTAVPAQRVTAQWQWLAADGTPIRTVNYDLSPGSDRTRWNATIAPDPITVDGSGRTQQGFIRPGRVTVTFRAETDQNRTGVRAVPSFWSYAAGEAANVGVALEGATAWCTVPGAEVRFAVEGLSIGFTENTHNPSAQDRVWAVFTTVDATGRARTE